MTPPYLYVFVIISPSKSAWSFIWTNENSLPKSDLYQIETDVFEKIFNDILFQTSTDVEIGFDIVAPPNPFGPWLLQTWIWTISESYPINLSFSGAVVLEKMIVKWLHCIFF
jgi:hypothetical protein